MAMRLVNLFCFWHRPDVLDKGLCFGTQGDERNPVAVPPQPGEPEGSFCYVGWIEPHPSFPRLQ
jgi:hypothetical protein